MSINSFNTKTSTEKPISVLGLRDDIRWPIAVEDVRTAIGRIGQDIKDPQYMGETTVGVMMGLNNGIIITRAGEKPMQFDIDGEASIPNTFRFAMRYLGNSLQADYPSNLTLLNSILERRLGVASSAPSIAVVTMATPQTPAV